MVPMTTVRPRAHNLKPGKDDSSVIVMAHILLPHKVRPFVSLVAKFICRNANLNIYSNTNLSTVKKTVNLQYLTRLLIKAKLD